MTKSAKPTKAARRHPSPRPRVGSDGRRRRRLRRPQIVISGFGRMGGALALSLRRAGWPVSIFPGSGESARSAAAFHFPLADHDSLREAQICMVAVPDNAVHHASQMLLGDLGEETALVHCSGGLDLSAFGSDPIVLERPRGSFHPLVAVSDPEDDLAGHAVALSASTPALLSTLKSMARDLRLSAIEVPEAGRPAYHAGAVLAAAGVVALAGSALAAFAQAGIEEDRALPAILPLIRSAIRGIERRGLSGALTGPIVRGDVAIIRTHLDALPTELRGLYRDLALRALAMVRAQLPRETRMALEEGLQITAG